MAGREGAELTGKMPKRRGISEPKAKARPTRLWVQGSRATQLGAAERSPTLLII